MANSHPQHRCVFVGNIPYDAKEEQLKEICEEVGPVVSFRLVIDRETGKPKGYGFCEYKDEETALSARRNLQGYEINGRQLRVDFAENDKNADKGREQGRGGPGMVASVENQKLGGPAALGDSSLHQPIGVSVAMTAGTVLTQALGAAQTGNQININNQPSGASDSITLHLAKMSRNQLIEVVSDMKAIATQNKKQARQLLLACSPMPKAILQALILLGLAPPAMLQMPNIKQASAPSLQPLVQDGLPSQLPATQNLSGFPSNLQNKVQYNGLDNAISAGRPISMLNNQQAVASQFPLQPHSQVPQLLHQSQFPVHSGNLNLPLMQPQSQGKFSFRPHGQVATSSFIQQVQNPQFQQLGPVNKGSQHAASFLSGVPDDISKDPRKQVMSDSIDPRTHPSKLVRLNDGRPMPSSKADNAVTFGSSQMLSTSGNQISSVEGSSLPEKQEAVQAQLPPDVESALLQQVLSLTPEQLRSLPPEQQQQVIQLQQMLRQAS